MRFLHIGVFLLAIFRPAKGLRVFRRTVVSDTKGIALPFSLQVPRGCGVREVVQLEDSSFMPSRETGNARGVPISEAFWLCSSGRARWINHDRYQCALRQLRMIGHGHNKIPFSLRRKEMAAYAWASTVSLHSMRSSSTGIASPVLYQAFNIAVDCSKLICTPDK